MMLALTVRVPAKFAMPPPKTAELPDRVVLLLIVALLLLSMPPPSWAELPEMRQPLTVITPSLLMPPPASGTPVNCCPVAELPDTMLAVTVNEPKVFD